MKDFCNIGLLATASFVALAFATSPVRAQDSTSVSPSAQEEVDGDRVEGLSIITVTAERRESTVQRTSIPIEVFDEDALGRAGISQATDLGRLTAGVQIGAIGATPQVYIRGVGDFGSTAITNPAVAFNIDGVYIGRTQSVNGSFFDIERVEVLKGPQGTLYGRNASGGAVNIITARPELGSVGGNFNLEVGNYSRFLTDGAINLPAGQDVAVRASFQVASRNGYTSQGLDDDKHESARFQIYWEPSETLDLLVGADYTHLGGRGAGSVLYPRLPDTSPWTDLTDPLVAPLYEEGSPAPGFINQPSVTQANQDLEFWSVHAELNADLGFATLTVLPAYRKADMQYTAFPTFEYRVGQNLGAFGEIPETSEQTTLEVRLGNDGLDGVNWVIGGYYYDESQTSDSLVFSGFIQNAYVDGSLGTRSYAAFGQATVPVLQDVRVILGGRYTYDRRTAKQIDRYTLFPSATCADPAVSICLNETLSGQTSFEDFSWKVGIEADLLPDSMFYATASRGFKAGGFALIGSIDPTSTQPASFDPEILTAYEIGLKSRFLNNRLQVNIEAFYWDYQDHQETFVTISGTGNVGQSLQNAGKARQYGADVDVIVQPWVGGTLAFSAEYLNSKYTEFLYETPAAFLAPGYTDCAVAPTGEVTAVGPLLQVDCSGFQLTRAPKWSGNASYAHNFALQDGAEIDAQASMTFASSRWLGPQFIQELRAPSYITFDASLSYRFAEVDLSLTAFVRNLTNEAVYTGALESPFIPTLVAANIAPPRTFGMRLEFDF